MSETITVVDADVSTVAVNEAEVDTVLLIEKDFTSVEVKETETIVVLDDDTVRVAVVNSGVQGPPGPPGEGGGEVQIMSKRYDLTAQDKIYVGEADPGVAESAPAWRIKRVDFDVNGNPTQTVWAAGGAQTQIWTDRLSLIYS